MTRWMFEPEPVGPLVDEPIVLLQQVDVCDDRGQSTSSRRSFWRRQVLARLAVSVFGPHDENMRLTVDADGRRRIRGTAMFASVAHRAGWVAAALAPMPVGVDIEINDEDTRADPVILAGVLPGIDLAAWHGLGGVWATREAVLKAQGRDLTRDHGVWKFGDGWVQGDDASPFRVDLTRCDTMIAAVAYAGVCPFAAKTDPAR